MNLNSGQCTLRFMHTYGIPFAFGQMDALIFVRVFDTQLAGGTD